MGFPTLLQRGSLVAPPDAPARVVPVEYITGRLKRKMPQFGGGPPAAADDRVYVVRAETGSGKSTVLVAYIFRLLRSERTPPRLPYRGRSVLCTQPRVLTAQTLAGDLNRDHKNYPDLVQGLTIGYQTGPISDRPVRGVIYATSGVLLQQLRTNPDSTIMDLYQFIVVDEAHERSLESDLLLYMLKRFLLRNLGNPKLPFMILASATIDPPKYAGYFGVSKENIVEVRGRQYPNPIVFPPRGTNDYVASAVETVLRLHEENPDDPPDQSDILVFMPGAREIEAVVEGLEKANRGFAAAGRPPLLVLPVMRETIEQSRPEVYLVKAPLGELWVQLPGSERLRPRRRVVVATVVAETGITIETLKYVVDPGWNREVEAYPPHRIAGLLTKPAARSRLQQRRGRVGREFPGEYHPLFTQNIWNALEPQQYPDIVTTGPGPILLDVIALQQRQEEPLPVAATVSSARSPAREFRVEEIDLLDPPPVDALAQTLEESLVLGFLSSRAPLAEGCGYGLTPLGQAWSRASRLTMQEARVLTAGGVWGAATSDLVTVVALFGRSLSKLVVDKPRPGVPPGADLLRTGLPPFLRIRGGLPARGGGEERPPTESETFYYRARLLLADDFLEGLLMFEGFAAAVAATGGDMTAAADWCREVGADLPALLDLAQRRVEIYNGLINAGFDVAANPDRRLALSTLETFWERVIALKRCIYDGLKLNRVSRGAAGDYRTPRGVAVRVPPMFQGTAAARLKALGVQEVGRRTLVTDRLDLKIARSAKIPPPLVYEVRAGLVSTLDGFLGVDAELLRPRAPE